MEKINLCNIINNHPSAIKDKKLFRSILGDYYPNPENKKIIYILSLFLGREALTIMKETNQITDDLFSKITNDIYNAFGSDKQLIGDCISIWAECYNTKMALISTEQSISNQEASSHISSAATNNNQQINNQVKQKTSVQSNSNSDFVIRNNALIEYVGSSRTVIIPDGVVEIGKEAFFDNADVLEVIIPSSVETIGDSAFSLCYSLETVRIENGLRSIGKEAFFSCRTLLDITLPDSVEYIGPKAFDSCDSLVDFALPSRLASLESEVFQLCSSLKTIQLNEGLTTIKKSPFACCFKIQELRIPSSVTKLFPNAFDDMDRNFMLLVEQGSYAENYARKNQIRYKIV